MQKNRIILHIDLDAFFASCEERENPRFRGMPIVVGADPKEGKGRGVVSTANYKAREFGIHSALPISGAWRLCPNAIFLPVNSSLYSRVSRSVMDILKNTAQKYNGEFNQTSVDEAYIDLSSSKGLGISIAKNLKHEIYKHEKITASIGMGPNMLIAKIASDFQKPNGLTIVKPKDVQKFLDPLPIRRLPGIGPKTERGLGRLGIKTVCDLRKIDQPLLYEKFGQQGISLYESSHGLDNRQVADRQATKSISEEHTFEHDADSLQEILPVLFTITKRVLLNASSQGYKKFRTITVRLRYADFKTHTKSLSGAYNTQNVEEIEKIALKLLWPFTAQNKKIRLIGFRVSRFE